MTIQFFLSENKPFIKCMLIDPIGGGGARIILNQLFYFWHKGVFVWKSAAVLLELYSFE